MLAQVCGRLIANRTLNIFSKVIEQARISMIKPDVLEVHALVLRGRRGRGFMQRDRCMRLIASVMRDFAGADVMHAAACHLPCRQDCAIDV